MGSDGKGPDGLRSRRSPPSRWQRSLRSRTVLHDLPEGPMPSGHEAPIQMARTTPRCRAVGLCGRDPPGDVMGPPSISDRCPGGVALEGPTRSSCTLVGSLSEVAREPIGLTLKKSRLHALRFHGPLWWAAAGDGVPPTPVRDPARSSAGPERRILEWGYQRSRLPGRSFVSRWSEIDAEELEGHARAESWPWCKHRTEWRRVSLYGQPRTSSTDSLGPMFRATKWTERRPGDGEGASVEGST